jgi:hypothetical protein
MSDFGVYHSYRNRVWMFAKNLPAPLLLPLVLVQSTAMCLGIWRHTVRPHRGAAMAGVRAGWSGLPAALRARREVQPHRTASSLQVIRMLDWHLLRRHVKLPPLLELD